MRDYPSTSRYEDSKPEQSWNKSWRIRLELRTRRQKNFTGHMSKKLVGHMSGVLKEQCGNSHPAVSSHHCGNDYGMHCCT